MIGIDQLKTHRLYEYKDKTVMVLGVGITEKNVKVVIYKNGMEEEMYPCITTVLEFCNHANLIKNKKELESVNIIEDGIKIV